MSLFIDTIQLFLIFKPCDSCLICSYHCDCTRSKNSSVTKLTGTTNYSSKEIASSAALPVRTKVTTMPQDKSHDHKHLLGHSTFSISAKFKQLNVLQSSSVIKSWLKHTSTFRRQCNKHVVPKQAHVVLQPLRKHWNPTTLARSRHQPQKNSLHLAQVYLLWQLRIATMTPR